MLQGPSHADRSGCVQGPSAVRGVGHAVPARAETRANELERVGRGSGIWICLRGNTTTQTLSRTTELASAAPRPLALLKIFC